MMREDNFKIRTICVVDVFGHTFFWTHDFKRNLNNLMALDKVDFNQDR